jgi:hypothetical protein
MRTMFFPLALVLWTGVAVAQNSFPTANGSTVPGYVLMCITGGKATPCQGTPVGSDSVFPTASGATTTGRVRMCITAGRASPC